MRSKIERVIDEHGLQGKPLCLHTSLRSFGPPPPRADDVIDAFLAAGCTVMAPTFSHAVFGTTPPEDMRPARNGTDYDVGAMANAGRDRVYDTASNELQETIGTLPRVLLQRAGRVRGNHPISSFTALGQSAKQLISRQSPTDVFAPLAALARADGYVALIGVGLTRMTLIHLAEKRAGRSLFRRWANGPDGRPMMIETGGCSEGFSSFEPVLAQIRRDATVGASRWQIFPARSALNLATHAIRRDPRITHCGDITCDRCNDGVAGGPLL